MTHRERILAVLEYRPYDRLPLIHFGYWTETLAKWRDEGHITAEEAAGWGDGNEFDRSIEKKLGFDANWSRTIGAASRLYPYFESRVIKELPDGSRHILNGEGMIVLQKPGAGSIPMEIEHTLTDRSVWEKEYLPRLQWSDDRLNKKRAYELAELARSRGEFLGVNCGSLYGQIRNWMGVQGIAYMYADDEDLYTEMIDTVGELCYRSVEELLKLGIKFDFGHFWEDICFKNGPLVQPDVFAEKVGPHYKRITDLLKRHGVNFVSVDCDGCIDSLLPIWLENGVNTMFPIEVGTWEASIAPWRAKYGRELRGVGGMDKRVFAEDYAAVDREVERLRGLVELGGYIPCPDHRIAPDGVWETVQYYCDRMHHVFG